ncbi:MAG: hypothetical protein ACRDJL_02930 [Actinomycetota bacterium]
MAALAYLFPPLTGLLAYSLGRHERVRWHGLQSVVFGFLWPVAIYAGSLAGPLGTRTAFALGALIWVGFFVITALGRDPCLPGGRRLKSLSGS